MKSVKTLFKIAFVIALVIAAAYLTGYMSIFSYAQSAINYIKETLAFGYEQVKIMISTITNFGG